jgi:fos-like antigen
MVQNKTQNVSLGSLVGACDTASTTSTTTSEALTPTTNKLLTELFQSDNCIDKLENIENEGFVVPLPPTAPTSGSAAPANTTKETARGNRKSFIKLDSSSWQGGTTTVVTPTKSEQLTILDVPASLTTMKTRSLTRSNSRINRPVLVVQSQPQRQETKPKKQANVRRTPKTRPGVKASTNELELSPDEAQKLNIRRERNKAAAARCRKRRMDQIGYLSEEVQVHEEKKQALENTIAQLKAQKEELEFILAQHQSECQLFVPGLQQQQQHQHSLPVAVKSEPVLVETIEMAGPMANQFYILDKPPQEIMTGRAICGGLKSKRPLSLNIESAQIEAKNPSNQVGGIVIDTPSNVISNLEFDTLMTSTGLTPTTNSLTPISFFTPGGSAPSCSSQQRSSEMIELNTPATENVSLVSL